MVRQAELKNNLRVHLESRTLSCMNSAPVSTHTRLMAVRMATSTDSKQSPSRQMPMSTGIVQRFGQQKTMPGRCIALECMPCGSDARLVRIRIHDAVSVSVSVFVTIGPRAASVNTTPPFTAYFQDDEPRDDEACDGTNGGSCLFG